MSSTSYRSNNVRRRQDVKERTMRRFQVLDEDIISRYDFEDDEDERRSTSDRRAFELRGRQRVMNRQLHLSSAGGRKELVNQVFVKCNGKATIEYILKSLYENVDDFVPFNIMLDNQKNVKFIVCTDEEAENIKFMARRIANPADSGDKFPISVSKIPAFWESLPRNLKVAIQDVVSASFRGDILDLSDFANHQIFADRDLKNLATLNRNAVMVEVILVAKKICPSARSLSLKNNRLSYLSSVEPFTCACPNIAELDLSYNDLKTAEELQHIRRWAVEFLFLENNPLCSVYAEASSLTNAIHEYFPRVSLLNGVPVHVDPFKISADNQRRAGLPYPPVQSTYIPDPALSKRVEAMLFEYFSIYDADEPEKKRQHLMAAYDQNATFTLTIHNLPEPRGYGDRPQSYSRGRGDDNAYRTYIRSTHNIINEEKWTNHRDRIVYKGALNIAAALCSLPITTHERDSITVEFVTVASNFLVVTVRGILRDGEDAKIQTGAKKAFARTFVIVPRDNDTLAIVNDVLALTPISPDRLTRYTNMFKKTMEAPIDPQPGPSGLQAQIQAQQVQQQMEQINVANPEMALLDQFSKQTNMKMEWAQKCLADCGWNYEAAVTAFQNCRNDIPQEAFIS